MTYSSTPNFFFPGLDRVAKARQEIANHFQQIINNLQQAELQGASASGKLNLERQLKDLNLASQNLQQGVFRLVVLGDLKRGKSTFLNALIGENLLPSDVNPCTALLTILRYGDQKQVTVYFKDETPPQQLDFRTFKQQYTINPDEAKQLEQQQKEAFPNVDYAVVECPLAMLQLGIEIVDTPGLNDTEARNELVLNYINNCQAVLFVFRAIKPITLDERRYLENYIKGRGLTVFFLINAWDELRRGLIDPDNQEELVEAETKQRQVFRTNLAEYCHVNGQDIYNQRVFEVSSLLALRRQIKDQEASLSGTGLPEFKQALNQFLTQEKGLAQLYQATILARQTYQQIHQAIERRLPLLKEDVEELKQKIRSVEPEFQQLTDIRNQYQAEIVNTRDRKAREITNSFRDYILSLGDTFEADFAPYQPDLGIIEYLQKGKREEFNAIFKQSFERYLNDKIAAWELTAEESMQEAFAQLARSAASYGVIYAKVTDNLQAKLIGNKVFTRQDFDSTDNSPAWANWAAGFFSLAMGNVAGVALAGAGFNWKSILVNSLAVIGIWSFLTIFSINFITGPLGLLLLGLGVGALQAEQGRKELMKATKKEFVKHLPQIAEQQTSLIEQAIKDCFTTYEQEIIKRINDDIKSRQAELNNLLEQKQSQEINTEQEVKRLQKLDADIATQVSSIESVYQYVI